MFPFRDVEQQRHVAYRDTLCVPQRLNLHLSPTTNAVFCVVEQLALERSFFQIGAIHVGHGFHVRLWSDEERTWAQSFYVLHGVTQQSRTTYINPVNAPIRIRDHYRAPLV